MFFCVMTNSPRDTSVGKKKLYSICIVEYEGEDEEIELEAISEKHNLEITNPHISMNASEGVFGCYTLKVTGWVDKLPIFIMIDSGSTLNIMNKWVANKLQCALTPIKPIIVKVVNWEKNVMDFNLQGFQVKNTRNTLCG